MWLRSVFVWHILAFDCYFCDLYGIECLTFDCWLLDRLTFDCCFYDLCRIDRLTFDCCFCDLCRIDRLAFDCTTNGLLDRANNARRTDVLVCRRDFCDVLVYQRDFCDVLVWRQCQRRIGPLWRVFYWQNDLRDVLVWSSAISVTYWSDLARFLLTYMSDFTWFYDVYVGLTKRFVWRIGLI